LVPLFLASCAQVVRKGGFGEVKSLLAERGTTAALEWRDDPADDQAAKQAVADLLTRELSIDVAVEVALLNNPSLQATYEDLGVAQANLVQAGLLKNPVFSGAVLFGGVSPAYDFDVVANFLDLLLLPARKRIAGGEYEQVRLRVAGAVVELAARVRAAYYKLQGAEQLVAVLEKVVSASEASAHFAEALNAAGNLNDLQLATHRALLEEVRADLLRATAETIAPREDLRELLGLAASDTPWQGPPTELPGVPDRSPTLEAVLSLADARRLELSASRAQAAVLSQTLATARAWRYLGGVEVGENNHREQGGKNWISGPSVLLELPVFDQRQAEIARLESELRQSQRRTEALSQSVAAEVRRAYGTLEAQRTLAEHYRRSLIPSRERVVALSQDFYNFMLLGAFDLLDAKRAEIGAYGSYIGAVRDYWVATAELDKAVGARVAIVPSAAKSAVEPVLDPTDAPTNALHQHHHGGH